MKDNQHAYALQIDGPLLRRQRQWLLNFVEKTTGDDRELLEGIISLLDEVADQAHDRYGIDCLLTPEVDEPQDSSPDNECRCHCEEPGHFNSGIPGILAHLENGRLPEGARSNGATSVAATHRMRRLWRSCWN